MSSANSSFNIQVKGYVQDKNTFVITLTTDDDTLVTSYFYSIVFFDETVLFETRLNYIDSDMITGMTWADLDLTPKNFVYKSSRSFFYGITGFSYNTNSSVNIAFNEGTLKTSGSMTFNTLQVVYFNIRVRQCSVPYYYFSNVSMQCWDTCSDPTMFFDPSNGNCIPCLYPCYSCDPTNMSLCLSCDPATNRFLNGTDCLCNPGFYEVGAKVCQPCPSWCVNCTSATVCTACDLSIMRFLSTGSCLCMDGYTDNQPKVTICQPCSSFISGCLTC